MRVIWNKPCRKLAVYDACWFIFKGLLYFFFFQVAKRIEVKSVAEKAFHRSKCVGYKNLHHRIADAMPVYPNARF